MTSTLHWRGYKVQVKRSFRRKTRAIEIQSDELVVRLLGEDSNQVALQILDKKSAWIHAKLQEICVELPESRLEEGSEWWFLGKPIVLNYTEELSELSTHGLFVSNKRMLDKRNISDLYQQTASRYLSGRVEYFEQCMEVKARLIQVKSYRARWGSCTNQGVVQFSWRLIQCPPEVIDYVVVHELAHLQHFNHGHEFWRLVETYYPERKSAQAWLKSHRELLRTLI